MEAGWYSFRKTRKLFPDCIENLWYSVGDQPAALAVHIKYGLSHKASWYVYLVNVDGGEGAKASRRGQVEDRNAGGNPVWFCFKGNSVFPVPRNVSEAHIVAMT